jgi:hypothetical protein
VAQDGVSILPCLLKKECHMNKKIVAISVLLLMMCAMTASVFADDEWVYSINISYTVEIKDKNGKTTGTKTETKEYQVIATSASEAENKARVLCEREFGRGNVNSCGVPIAIRKVKE